MIAATNHNQIARTPSILVLEHRPPGYPSRRPGGRHPHFERAKKDAATVKAVWAPEGENLSWLYRTALPHATFQVNEDGEPYCRGIVFLLSDAA